MSEQASAAAADQHLDAERLRLVCRAVVRTPLGVLPATAFVAYIMTPYAGAALAFPRQGYDNTDQPIGSLLVWPSLVTHPHEATQLASGTKYALTIWCELPGEAALY